jgi:hypothetical protein
MRVLATGKQRPERRIGASGVSQTQPDDLGVLGSGKDSLRFAEDRIGDAGRLVETVDDAPSGVMEAGKRFWSVLVPCDGVAALSRRDGSSERSLRSPASNQSANSDIRCHFVISGQVAVVICGPVLAVMRQRVSTQVVMPQPISHAISADLPGPTPPAIAIRNGLPWARLSRMYSRISRCHSSGPGCFASGPPSSPHG